MTPEQQAAISESVIREVCYSPMCVMKCKNKESCIGVHKQLNESIDAAIAAHLKALEAAGLKLIPKHASGETINAMAEVIRQRDGRAAAITAQLLWDGFIVAARPR